MLRFYVSIYCIYTTTFGLAPIHPKHAPFLHTSFFIYTRTVILAYQSKHLLLERTAIYTRIYSSRLAAERKQKEEASSAVLATTAYWAQ